MTKKIKNSVNLPEFENLIDSHEELLASILKTPTVKKQLFPGYTGSIKSLGAWGGDFILATGNQETPEYFKNKGFSTILSYADMIK